MNLFGALIGIGLLVAIAGTGLSYLGPSAQSSGEARALVAAGFQALVQAYQSRTITGAPAPAADSWESALFPAYGRKPTAPAGTRWSFARSAAGAWFCLSTSRPTPALRSAFSALKPYYSAASYQVSARCGETEADSSEALAATLWVTREGA